MIPAGIKEAAFGAKPGMIRRATTNPPGPKPGPGGSLYDGIRKVLDAMSDEHTRQLQQCICRELPALSEPATSELRGILERLIAALEPERIYVFGSQARGDARDDSDIDLLIIVPDSDLPAHRRDQAAYGAVGRHFLPLDLLVMTRAEFERRRSALASLPATVLREGRVLYAA